MSCRNDPPPSSSDPRADQPCDSTVQSCPLADLAVHVVHQQTGASIAGADVTVIGLGTKPTNAEGWANWERINPGTYDVMARKNSHIPDPGERRGVNVPPNTTTTTEIRLLQLALEIIDRKTGAVVSGTTQTKIVGQKIELQVRTNPAGLALTNIQWTVPGERVKNYVQSAAAGTKTELVAADLQKTNLDFYWIAGGNQNITVVATVQSARLTAQVTHDVQRPTINRFNITTSSVNVTTAHWVFPGRPALAALQPTPPPRRFGSQWDAQVTAPAAGDGEIGFTQRIFTNRTRTKNDGTVENFTEGRFLLDDGLGIQYSGSQPIAAGASATLSGNAYADSPATELTADLRAKSVDERFELYLMYKPAGADSIWVTLGMGTWAWRGETTRIGAPASAANNWNPATGTAMPSANGTDSTTLPEWTGAHTSVTWR